MLRNANTVFSPGETLPPLPEPTHTAGSVTIKSVLEELESNHRDSRLSHHDPRFSKRFAKPKVRYDPNCFAKTICCGGDGNYHPSGIRNFTIREYACLQTFPWRFVFGQGLSDTEIRTQIGNAVPPSLARAIFVSILESLRASDQTTTETREGVAVREVIELD